MGFCLLVCTVYEGKATMMKAPGFRAVCSVWVTVALPWGVAFNVAGVCGSVSLCVCGLGSVCLMLI